MQEQIRTLHNESMAFVTDMERRLMDRMEQDYRGLAGGLAKQAERSAGERLVDAGRNFGWIVAVAAVVLQAVALHR